MIIKKLTKEKKERNNSQICQISVVRMLENLTVLVFRIFSIMGGQFWNLWLPVVVCLMLVDTGQGHLFQYNYKKLKIGETIMGSQRGEYAEQSQYDCSIRYDKKKIMVGRI